MTLLVGRHFHGLNTYWRVPSYYTDEVPIGNGACGIVIAFTDTRDNSRVAIKKLKRPFHNSVTAKRAHREISLLKHCNHDNIIRLLDAYTPSQSLDNFSDVYLVLEYQGGELQSKIDTERFEVDHIRLICYQILCALKYLHGAGIIHRDLKPENIVMNEYLDVKILDFGLSRAMSKPETSMTMYVATRPYRAPELLCGVEPYDGRVDVWSLGCIMASIAIHKLLFEAADHISHIKNLIQVLGGPPEEFLARCEDSVQCTLLTQTKETPVEQTVAQLVGASTHLSDASDQDRQPLIHAIGRCLQWDPSQRPSACDMLADAFFARYHDGAAEPEGPPYRYLAEEEEEAGEAQPGGATAQKGNSERAEERAEIDAWKKRIWTSLQHFGDNDDV